MVVTALTSSLLVLATACGGGRNADPVPMAVTERDVEPAVPTRGHHQPASACRDHAFTDTRVNKLFVFLPGTSGLPTNYRLICAAARHTVTMPWHQLPQCRISRLDLHCV